MKQIFVTSDEWSTGKTMFCAGLALSLIEKGVKVGYFKPIGARSPMAENTIDTDVLLMKDVLNLTAPLEKISLITLGDNYPAELGVVDREDLLAKVEAAHKELSENVDFLIIEGWHQMHALVYFQLAAPVLAARLGAQIMLVCGGDSPLIVDNFLLYKAFITAHYAKLVGVVIENIGPPATERIEKRFVPLIESTGVPIWGKIPWEAELFGPTVKEIQAQIGGELIGDQDFFQRPVENFFIGESDVHLAIPSLREMSRKAVIVSGDRTDILLASLDTDTSLLILSGNIQPETKVIARAMEKKVPILVVPYNSSETYKLAIKISSRINIGNNRKISAAKRVVEKHVDIKGLLNEL